MIGTSVAGYCHSLVVDLVRHCVQLGRVAWKDPRESVVGYCNVQLSWLLRVEAVGSLLVSLSLMTKNRHRGRDCAACSRSSDHLLLSHRVRRAQC